MEGGADGIISDGHYQGWYLLPSMHRIILYLWCTCESQIYMIDVANRVSLSPETSWLNRQLEMSLPLGKSVSDVFVIVSCVYSLCAQQ